MRFPDAPLPMDVAKTVAVLQILGNMPVTAQNVASLLHPQVDAASRRPSRWTQPSTRTDRRRASCPSARRTATSASSARRSTTSTRSGRRLPAARHRDAAHPERGPARAVQPAALDPAARHAGGDLRPQGRGRRRMTASAGRRAGDDPDRGRAGRSGRATRQPAHGLVDESRQRSAATTIFLLGRSAPEIDDQVGEIYRCREIVQRYRNDPDQEVKDYCVCPDRPGRPAGRRRAASAEPLR